MFIYHKIQWDIKTIDISLKKTWNMVVFISHFSHSRNHRYLIKKYPIDIPFFPVKKPTIFHPTNQKIS